MEAVLLKRVDGSALGRGPTLTIPGEPSEPREPSREPNCGGIRDPGKITYQGLGTGFGVRPVFKAHLMEQVGLQQGRFITQSRVRGLRGQ